MQAIDWHRIDWSKRDAEIGREVNRSRERIRQIREKLDKPKALYRQMSDKGIALREWFVANPDKSGTMTARQLAQTLNCTVTTVARLAKRFRFKLCKGHNRDPRFALMDWRLPNIDLRHIWRFTDPPSQHPGSIVGRYRHFYGYPSPTWDKRCNDTDMRTNHTYRHAYAAEVEKAEAYFEEVGQ